MTVADMAKNCTGSLSQQKGIQLEETYFGQNKDETFQIHSECKKQKKKKKKIFFSFTLLMQFIIH